MTISLPPLAGDSTTARSRSGLSARSLTREGHSDARVLLVASPGGHTDELKQMADHLELCPEQRWWVSSRTGQTEEVLAGERVAWVGPIKSSEVGKSMRAVPAAISLHRGIRPDLVVSTGAAMAAPHLLAASAMRCPAWFIESATRTSGPSRVGRLVQRLPGVRLFAQGEGWGDPRWERVPSVFDAYRVAEDRNGPTIETATVSLGSEKFPFERAVTAVRRVLAGSEVAVDWQVGTTPTSGLQQWMHPSELRRSFSRSDVVVTHAGVGSLLAALGCGKVPIVFSRRQARGEHVDDHQVQIAEQLAERGLVLHVDPDELTWHHFVEAASRRVERTSATHIPVQRSAARSTAVRGGRP